MADKPAIFLDTSALFSGLWSTEGGARLILRLGEADIVRLLVCSQVLAEIESALRRKAPVALGDLAVLLDRMLVKVVDQAPPARFETCLALIGHAGDERVLANAWHAIPDYFVSLDRQHFLDNTTLRQALPFPMGTPGDCLAWLRGQLNDLK